ncbi:MAG TPA: hypothetical protein PKN69_01960, partial [Candidatus Latescibacteria bacterium]|nr:hypothetical protein [Candidatus Latescibacterota bacterium]
CQRGVRLPAHRAAGRGDEEDDTIALGWRSLSLRTAQEACRSAAALCRSPARRFDRLNDRASGRSLVR